MWIVELIQCNSDAKRMGTMLFEKLPMIGCNDPTSNLDLIWKCSIIFGKERPNWAGTMQMVHKGVHPGKSSVMFLPIIDINPSVLTCVYSTLHYISKHAENIIAHQL